MNLTESRTRTIIRRYEELCEQANVVAGIVFNERYPSLIPKTHFDHFFDKNFVQSSFYIHQDPECVQWPLNLLWADESTIRTTTREQIATEKKAIEVEKERQRQQTEAAERRTYERLKSKYDW